MNRTAAGAATDSDLTPLIHELLDAHADTIQLHTEPAAPGSWAMHVDYLRALLRKGKEILARTSSAGGQP